MDSTVAYLNGRFVALSDANLSIADAGFVYGATVTDRVRTFRKQLFRLEEHLIRFRQSCELGGVPQPVADSRLHEVAIELTERNARLLPTNAELILVMCATPGTANRLVGEASDGPPTILMHTFALPFAKHMPLFTRGARLAVPAMIAPPPSVIDPRIKHRSRIHWWIANAQARAIDLQADGLLCDEHGNITETSSASVLVVRGNEVVRARAGTVLEGVSMKVVREQCGKAGIPFREQPLTLEDCLAADELLVTCTTWCVAGVSALNNRAVPWPGPILQRLQAAWSEMVGLDIAEQFTSDEV